ncbi:helix-turn-helix domain-containing protein [Streptomyces sp. NPDC005423]|uniref:helix-turn-helix domain-containing protein n=1 Tax=Streptomyces sp. NPDC005423 TaxID=3155343 RepID=UPI0033A50C0B
MNQPTHCPFDPYLRAPECSGGRTGRGGVWVPDKGGRVDKAQVRGVIRARIVLAAADGLSNGAIARELAVTVNTVRKWRGRFVLHGPDGLKDAGRSGRSKIYGPQVRVAIVAAATGAPPHPKATWSHRTITAQVADTVHAAISASQVGRILADLDLKPHRVRGWLTRRDTPDFWDRVADVCDLYRNPPGVPWSCPSMRRPRSLPAPDATQATSSGPASPPARSSSTAARAPCP